MHAHVLQATQLVNSQTEGPGKAHYLLFLALLFARY